MNKKQIEQLNERFASSVVDRGVPMTDSRLNEDKAVGKKVAAVFEEAGFPMGKKKFRELDIGFKRAPDEPKRMYTMPIDLPKAEVDMNKAHKVGEQVAKLKGWWYHKQKTVDLTKQYTEVVLGWYDKPLKPGMKEAADEKRMV